MLRSVVTYPDSRLAKIAEPIAEINQEVRDLARDLQDTLTYIGGVGMAAPQIGAGKRLVVVDISQALNNPDAPQEFRVIINPEIDVLDAALNDENEGCLSVPDYRAVVSRPRHVRLRGLDLDGKPVMYDGTGYFGACLQHETDHLDGKLFIDRISYLKRSIFEKKMKKKK